MHVFCSQIGVINGVADGRGEFCEYAFYHTAFFSDLFSLSLTSVLYLTPMKSSRDLRAWPAFVPIIFTNSSIIVPAHHGWSESLGPFHGVRHDQLCGAANHGPSLTALFSYRCLRHALTTLRPLSIDDRSRSFRESIALNLSIKLLILNPF